MAARGNVFLEFVDGKDRGFGTCYKTDLTGHGNVRVGEEFVARNCFPNGGGKQVIKRGTKLRVRVEQVEAVHRSYHILHVAVLEDLTPAPDKQAAFDFNAVEKQP